MGLFNKKKPVAPPPTPKPIMEANFIRSAGFRGFKRFRVTVHGIEDAERNAVTLKDADLKDAQISFKVFLDQYRSEYADVFINGLRVGIVYDPDEIYAIKHKLFDQVYAMFENETVLVTKGTITRPRVRMFVKYIENTEENK